jgi:hypothetical protein
LGTSNPAVPQSGALPGKFEFRIPKQVQIAEARNQTPPLGLSGLSFQEF